MDRVKLIASSLRIFALGLASLLPVVGFVPALLAAVSGLRLGKQSREEWNPASAYLSWGIALALLSIGINLLAGSIYILNLVPPFATD